MSGGRLFLSFDPSRPLLTYYIPGIARSVRSLSAVSVKGQRESIYLVVVTEKTSNRLKRSRSLSTKDVRRPTALSPLFDGRHIFIDLT